MAAVGMTEHRMNHSSRGQPLPGSTLKPSRAGTPTSGATDPISTGLRRLLSSVSEEPVPDDFLRLLDALDESMKDRP